ncbi:MKRN2 opposite strand, tandem duplicate 1 [Trichomycterus rosablanca]|uniref:MKRN2 opposite strand, tandem duplicate 1 n=1 Tax=Trichomycterus rosablanca TaxID=2290929 RepID=UPI002F35F2B5
MNKTVIRFRHCGKDIYRFSEPNVSCSLLDEQREGYNDSNVCPVCCNPLHLGLLDAPVALPCPFSDGHRAPCAFLIGANSGVWTIGEWSDTELHVGLSDSKGLVYNYTLAGVQKDERGWEQCVCISLVPPLRHDLTELWDKELKTFSSLPAWTRERFDEERESGSCCYGFALTFINHMRSLDNKPSLSRNQFTGQHILPRMNQASMYIRVYEKISQNGFYVVEK